MRLSRLLVCFLLIAPARATAAPILVNGSFEIGPPVPTHDIDILAGSTEIAGWLVTGTSIDYLGDAWDVSDGTRAVDLDGRDATFSGIQQTFATEIGQTYSVTFDLSGNPEGGSLLKLLQVSVGDFSQDYSFDSSDQTLDALIWQTITFSFLSLETTSTLAFTSLSSTPNSYGPLVDNVSVTAVPEPATVLLIASAFPFLRRTLLRRTARRSGRGARVLSHLARGPHATIPAS